MDLFTGPASLGQPTRAYPQQLCTDTECCLEDLPQAMEDRDEERERERERKRERERGREIQVSFMT